MEKFEKKMNEQFFENIFRVLNEGGKYGWINENKIFTKVNEKLVAEDNEAYEKVKQIVSKEYLNKRFEIISVK